MSQLSPTGLSIQTYDGLVCSPFHLEGVFSAEEAFKVGAGLKSWSSLARGIRSDVRRT